MTRTVPGIFAAVILITIRTSDAATCATNFSSSTFVKDFGFTASHESAKNKANDVFTDGWCAGINSGSSIHPTLDVDFKHPYGIKSITVGPPTNRDSIPYPTNVLVKYIPNGGNAFVNFPLAEGKLEINLTGPGNAQTSFSQGIAAKQLQFTIQSYNGEDACLRIQLVGCAENDLCSGVCQNGGLCMYEDQCQCAGGFIGNHCELSGCTPEPLGLSTGAIKPDQITVSSEDPTNNKAELGNDGSKKGWCPLPSDQHPWVTIKLHEPKAVSVFSFNWASLGNTQIMTEFELQYVAPVDSSKRFRTFATDIPSMNGTHIFTVKTSPVMVTDTIRILPTYSTGRSCFKLEIEGCDPKTLCSAGWCLNNGSCMGENVCRCPANFFGDRCEQTRNDIVHTDLTFVNITNNVIITTSTTLQFHITGNVVLQTIQNKPVVIINGTHSSIQLSSTTGPSCVTDVNHCTNGFTFIVDIKFISIVDNTYIVSSGGNVPGHTGITLFYTSNNLHFIVSTTNSMWTLTVPYKPIINVWQHFEITWHKNLGVELIVNGHSLGTNSRPAPQQATAVNLPLCIGCSHTNINVNIHMQITGILSWSIDRTELVNAGIKDPPSSTSAPAPTVSTSPTTTDSRSTSSDSPITRTTTTGSSSFHQSSSSVSSVVKTSTVYGTASSDSSKSNMNTTNTQPSYTITISAFSSTSATSSTLPSTMVPTSTFPLSTITTSTYPLTKEISSTYPSTKVTNGSNPSTKVINSTYLSTKVTNDSNPSTKVTISTYLSTKFTNDSNPSTKVTISTYLSTKVTNGSNPSTKVTYSTYLSNKVTTSTDPSTKVTNGSKLSTNVTNSTFPSTKISTSSDQSTKLTTRTPPSITSSTLSNKTVVTSSLPSTVVTNVLLVSTTTSPSTLQSSTGSVSGSTESVAVTMTGTPKQELSTVSTKMTIATPSTSSLPFQQYNLTFLSITSNILITPSFNFTLHNKPTLELQNNSHTALVLNCSEKQYVELPDKGIPCLESLADCKDGFTFKMEVMFTKIEPAEKTYLLSSGGDAAGVSGMAIYIHSNQLIFGVKQGMNHWTGMHDMTGIIQTNVWYKIEVSWNATKGILAIIDGQEVIKESKWTPSPSVDKSNPVLIGKTEDSNYTSCMKVRDLFTWTTHRDILVDHGILPVPSTSTKAPTTSTTTPTTTPTTTTSTTTLPTTTAIPVPIFTWNFTSIVNNVIIGIEYNLTVYGTPVVVNGGLLINSSTQYIEFGKPQQNCLNDPESCIHGLTIQFTLQINKFEENTYFFTSGGQLPDGVGIAVIYRFGRIQFILTTNTSSWFISVTKNHFKPNQYHTITISWNLTIGLEVFVNNILIDSNKVPDNHQSALINATTTYIGKQPDTSVKVEFLLNVVTIWYVHIDILVEQGKCEPPVRPTTPPSTTTHRPTTTGKPTTTTSTTTPSATTAKSTFTSVMTKTTPPDQCPVGCVSIATGTSKPTTTPAPTTAPTTTSTTPTSTTTKQTTTRTTSTTAKPQPTATSAPIVPTPDTATPPPPSTRHPTPDYNVKPIIHVTVEKDKNAYLVCTFEPAKQSGVEITVSLIVEQKVVFVLSVGGNTGEAMFEVSKVNMFLYQKKIQCSVSAKWIGSSVTTTIYYSNIFVPSITVKPETLIVVEGHSKEFITVTSTIPPQFFCCDGCKAQCQVHIVGIFHYDRYFQTCGRDVIAQALIEGTKPSNFNEQICGYTLTIDNWNQDNKIQVIATVDNRRDGDHRNTMEVVANVYNQPQTAQITVKPNVYTVTTVQVTIKDNDLSPAICKSVNDPHMTTFDGQRYDNMVEGEFILYRHLSLPFEVRAFYHKCSSRSHATCNCAVAIKSGDDVITITGCQGTVSGGHPGQGHGLGLIFQQIFGSHGNAHGHDNKDELAKTPMTIQIYKNGELTPGTHIRRFGCGQKYEILLPTGMIVAVEQSWKPFINIWITASSFDRGNSEGLCGNFDGNRGNDIKGNVNSFIQLWKDPPGYFFFGVGVSSHTVTSNFCSCVKDKNKICLPGLGAMRCESYRVDSDITATLVLHAKLPILTRTKRQAVVATDAPNTDIVPDAVQMSYEQAVANCTDAIGKNRVTQACTPILTANISEQIDNCAHDYNATGNFEWATDALRDIVVDCVNTANMLIAANASGNTNVTDELPAIPDNIDEILGNACVDKCSEHSNCTNGVCVCNPGYSGVTCDISKQTTPTVAQAPYMCDISVTSDCMAAVMYGDNFVESEDLTCHFEYVQVSDKVTPTGETGKSKAVYISINQVTCLLPKLLSARISISNDGKTQSNMSSIHVAYNSICHDCSAEDSTSVPSCIRKENNCVINGVCFAEGATRPGDNCQVCKSAATSSDWSKNNIAECMPVPVEAEKVSSEDDKKKVLALAIVCGVLAAILLIALIYALRVRAAKKSSKGEFGEYDVASQQHKLHRNNYDNPVMYESNPTYNEKM